MTTPAPEFDTSRTPAAPHKATRAVRRHAGAPEFTEGVEVTEIEGPLPSEFAQLLPAAAEGGAGPKR